MLTICVVAPAPTLGDPQAPDQQRSGDVKKPAQKWDARLRALDANRDGRVTFAEWDADDTSFDVRDWDNDGFLSGDEVVAGAVCPTIPARPCRLGGDPYDVIFERLDANHDDHLSEREFQGTAAALVQLDFNRDGLLSPLEFGVGR